MHGSVNRGFQAVVGLCLVSLESVNDLHILDQSSHCMSQSQCMRDLVLYIV